MLKHLIYDAVEEATRRGIKPDRLVWETPNSACLVGVMHKAAHGWQNAESLKCLIRWKIPTRCHAMQAKFCVTEKRLEIISYHHFSSPKAAWDMVYDL